MRAQNKLTSTSNIKRVVVISLAVLLVYFVRSTNEPGSLNSRILSHTRVLTLGVVDTYCQDDAKNRDPPDSVKKARSEILDVGIEATQDRNRAKLGIFLKDPKNKEQEGKDYVQAVAMKGFLPWAILAGITLLGWLCCTAYCLYDYYACGPKCCNPCKNSCGSKIVVLFFLVFTAGVVATGIGGYFVDNDTTRGIKASACSAFKLVDVLLNGVQSYPEYQPEKNATTTWFGLNPLLTSVGIIRKELVKAPDALQEEFPANDNSIKEGRDNLAAKINLIWDNNNARNVTNPDVTTFATKPSININEQGTFGPPTTKPNSMTGILQQELDIKINIVTDIVTKVSQTAVTISQEARDRAKNIEEAEWTVGNLTKSLNDIVKNEQLEQQNAPERMNSTFGGLFGAAIFWMILALLGIMVYTVTARKLTCFPRFCLIFGWCMATFLAIAIFLLAGAIITFSMVSVDLCSVMDKILDDKAEFRSIMLQALDKDEKQVDNLETCVFKDGGGDLMSKLGVTAQIADIANITSQINELQNISGFNSSQSSFVSSVQKWLVNILAFIQSPFSPPDAPGANTTNAGVQQGIIPYAQISALNEYTDSSVSPTKQSCGTPLKDQWVMNYTDCGGSYTGRGSAGTAGSETCLQFAVDQSDSGVSPARYAGASCNADTTAAVTDRVDKLNQYAASVKLTYAAMQIDVDNYAADNAAFNDKLAKKANSVIALNQTIAGLLTQTFKIVKSTNCGFVGTGLRSMVDAYCGQTAPALREMGMWLAALAVFLMLGSLFGCLTQKCYMPNPKHSTDAKGPDGGEYAAPGTQVQTKTQAPFVSVSLVLAESLLPHHHHHHHHHRGKAI